eukprot:UN13119
MENPFIHLKPPHSWNTSNAVLNYMSSLCSEGYLTRSLLGNKAVATDWFVFSLTCEPNIKLQKIRVQIIKESDLLP